MMNIEIEHTTDGDVEQITSWLLDERKATGRSFASNLPQVEEAHRRGLLVAAKMADEVVGFHFGWFYRSGITVVRPDWRGQRVVGPSIAQWVINRARARGVCGLNIECSSSRSEKFWADQGFTIKGNPSGHSIGWMELEYPASNTHGIRTSITASFFDSEMGIYPNTVKPYRTSEVMGFLDGNVFTPDMRVAGVRPGGPPDVPVFAIQLSGEDYRFFPEDAKRAGLREDEAGWWFFETLDLGVIPLSAT